MATLLDKLANDVAAKTGMTDIRDGVRNGDTSQLLNGFNTLARGPQVSFFDEEKNLHREATIKSNTSFSGTDCLVIAQINYKLIVLGNLETFSYSIFREKSPVRVLGKSYAKGYTAGGRTIGGSMVFIVFDTNPLYAIIRELKSSPRRQNERFSSSIADQLPPIDFMILFGNEYGSQAILKLYGVEIVQEGQTHSINDIYSENIMQYVARDIDVMINYEEIGDFKNMLFEKQTQGLFVDSYLESMLSYKRKLENEISTLNMQLSQQANERAKRGIATLGIGLAFSGDINDEEQRLIGLKKSKLMELESVNNQIFSYQRKITGWNAQSGDGNIDRTNLNQANNIGVSPLTVLGQ